MSIHLRKIHKISISIILILIALFIVVWVITAPSIRIMCSSPFSTDTAVITYTSGGGATIGVDTSIFIKKKWLPWKSEVLWLAGYYDIDELSLRWTDKNHLHVIYLGDAHMINRYQTQVGDIKIDYIANGQSLKIGCLHLDCLETQEEQLKYFQESSKRSTAGKTALKEAGKDACGIPSKLRNNGAY